MPGILDKDQDVVKEVSSNKLTSTKSLKERIEERGRAYGEELLALNRDLISSTRTPGVDTPVSTAEEELLLIREERKVLAEQRAVVYPVSKKRGYVMFSDFLFHSLLDLRDNVMAQKYAKTAYQKA